MNPRPASTDSASRAELDKELIQRFIAGDEKAFIEIVEYHRPRMYSLALPFVHSHEDAEEVASDTFIRAHRALHTFRGDCSLASWLHRICFNIARNRYWYNRRRRQHLTLSLNAEMGEDCGVTLADTIVDERVEHTSRKLDREQFIEAFEQNVEKLCPRHREILKLWVCLKFNYKEIAVAMGLNIGTVKSCLARARTMLRRHMNHNESPLIAA